MKTYIITVEMEHCTLSRKQINRLVEQLEEQISWADTDWNRLNLSIDIDEIQEDDSS